MESSEELKINDGGGLFDSVGFIETIILDCNNAVKQLVGGNYIAFCNGMAEIVKKLAVLKEGVDNEKQAMTKQVDEMGKQLENERSRQDAAGLVHNTLSGTVGDMLKGIRDAEAPAPCGLEQDQGDGCT